MISIRNEHLTVDLLDPVADRAKTGSRYCNGCYIWQVYDNAGRALLSGPRFPSVSPPVFDGQGAPEAFEAPLCGGDCAVGGEVCVIGVGLVRKSSGIEPFHPRNNPDVILPCEWDIDVGGDHAVMATEQSGRGGRRIRLRREVRIDKNIVKSITVINNAGDVDVGIRRFAHPFFPLNAGLTCGKITPKLSLPKNAGYYMTDDGTIRMTPDYPWEKGLFQPLGIPDLPAKLSFAVRHPIVGTVGMRTDHDVVRCPVWANANTFSFEPFSERTVKPGESASWGIEYRFGD